MSKTINLQISNYLKYLKEKSHSSPLTVRNYTHYLSRFSNFLEEHFPTLDAPEEIDGSVIREYSLYISKFIDNKGELLDTNTQGYHLIALRSFLKYLNYMGQKTINADAVRVPHSHTKEIKFLDLNEVATLIRLAENKRDRSILELLLSTGLRVSDLVRLNRDELDFEKKQISLSNSRGQKRTIFLSESAAYWLGKYLEEREDDSPALFIRTAGRKEGTLRLTVRSIQRIVEKYVKKAGFSVKATPKSLRHTFAISLLTGGTPLSAVKNLLNHKNISTTQIYTHVTNPQLKEIHNKFHRR